MLGAYPWHDVRDSSLQRQHSRLYEDESKSFFKVYHLYTDIISPKQTFQCWQYILSIDCSSLECQDYRQTSNVRGPYPNTRSKFFLTVRIKCWRDFSLSQWGSWNGGLIFKGRTLLDIQPFNTRLLHCAETSSNNHQATWQHIQEDGRPRVLKSM